MLPKETREQNRLSYESTWHRLEEAVSLLDYARYDFEVKCCQVCLTIAKHGDAGVVFTNLDLRELVDPGLYAPVIVHCFGRASVARNAVSLYERTGCDWSSRAHSTPIESACAK